METLAAVLREPGLAGLAVETVTLDDPAPHEVLVRVVGSGLCHSDLHFIDGSLPLPGPRILGHEVSGIVQRVGGAVRLVRPGDHVVTCFTMPCGRCATCVAGQENLCERRSEQWNRGPDQPPRVVDRAGQALAAGSGIGGLAQHVVMHERGLVAIDEQMPLVPAALLGCAVLTGTGAVFRTAGVRAGDNVAVIGCGGVGLSIIQAARIAGATRVVALDRVEHKLNTARAFGATDAVLVDQTGGHVEAVKALLPRAGVDHAFEAVGTRASVADAFAMLATRGTATVVGIFGDGVGIDIPARSIVTRETRIQGSYVGSASFRHDVPQLVAMYRAGRLRLDEMIEPRLALADVRSGFELMQSGAALRPVVDLS